MAVRRKGGRERGREGEGRERGREGVGGREKWGEGGEWRLEDNEVEEDQGGGLPWVIG